ncbi:MAG: prepilin-type N-terminal cleavage/methylation domain-containing protein [Candidatus Omnitrophica bacterium]|nr:prepilin-type N-terminal cleavage/methylation domain-containing protein [Candidatus Omnitrophota bacterium]MCB9748237.1 prepilin-type N-terminal cleavage/methylation domain-containing protein [Candidatus Omnitrophota bacterium]
MKNYRPYKNLKSIEGFTLVEMIVVLLIFGVGMAAFSLTLSTYWTATDTHVKRSDIYQELNTIIERVSFDGRSAQIIDVVNSKNTIFIDDTGNIIVQYKITSSDEFQQIPNGTGTPIVLSKAIDAAQSGFIDTGKGILLDIHMKDDSFGKPINISTQTEIFPRNVVNQL